MSDPLHQPDDAATPLTPAEKLGLIPSYITTRGELNEAEQANILKAQTWAANRRGKRNILDESFLRQLHRRMFADVWKWAGKIRTTERNLGVLPYLIPIELHQLLEDTKVQIELETYRPDEIACRFHHRLVSIHPFPNGNGRHSRLATDLFLDQLGQPPFTWGAGDLTHPGHTRKNYIAALRAADNHDMAPLLNFVRSTHEPS